MMVLPRFAVSFVFLWALAQPCAQAFVQPSYIQAPKRLRALAAVAKDGEGEPQKARPDTSLQMGDATLEAPEVEDIVDKSASFQAIVEGIKEFKTAQGGDSPVAFSEEDMRLLKMLLNGSTKSKFEEDAYWADVRLPVDEATTINPEVFRSQEFFDLERTKILEVL